LWGGEEKVFQDFAGGQGGLGGGLGGDDRGFFQATLAGEVGEGLQLPPGHFRFLVKGFVGGGFGGRVKVDGAPAHRFELNRPAAGFFQRCRHHQHRRLGLLRQGGGDKPLGQPRRPAELDLPLLLQLAEQF